MLSKLSRYIHPMNCYALAATILTQSLAVAQISDIIPGIDYMPPGDLEQVQAMVPGAETLDGGIRFRVDAPGKGSYIEKGNRVEAVYTGRLLNGKIFNRKSISYHTYWFTVGAEPRQIIRGWERVMPLMQKKEVATPSRFQPISPTAKKGAVDRSLPPLQSWLRSRT